MQELVSIITPAYKAEAFICRTVRSVVAQSYPEWEMLIIADDDVDYQALLRSKGICDPRLRFLKTKSPRSGPNRARNLGLEAAKGAWLAPLDADDFFLPNRLSLLLAEANETGLAVDNGYVVYNTNDSKISKIYHRLEDGCFTFTSYVKAYVPLLFLFHRCLIYYGWDADIERGADTIFNLRALEAAGYARYTSQALHEYNIHDQSICHSAGAALCFDHAYQHTINRILDDGLGFQTEIYRHRVIAFIAGKKKLNNKFDEAISKGYEGNYQSFLTDYGLRH